MHRSPVAKLFDRISAPPDVNQKNNVQAIKLSNIWDGIKDENNIKILETQDPSLYNQLHEILISFSDRLKNRQFGPKTRARLEKLLPEVVLSVEYQDPIQAVTRLIHLIESIGRRSLYITLMLENISIFI